MELINKINDLLKTQSPVVVAIDGRCASGKTTLADKLCGKLSCCCIHMDDFFLQPHQRTPERLQQTGGNIDHERFLSEVLIPMSQRIPFSYRPFNCKTMSFNEPVHITPDRVTIIEGVYSCHPLFRKFYDLTVFLDVSADMQRERIMKRSPMLADKFFTSWIPMEEKYFTEFDIRNNCDMML